MPATNLRFDMDYPPTINHYYVRTPTGMAIGKPGLIYREVALLMLSKHKHFFDKDQRLAIAINVFPPDQRKRDLDNILKCTLDSIQFAQVFDDDNQIDSISVIRMQPVDDGKLSIWLRECS